MKQLVMLLTMVFMLSVSAVGFAQGKTNPSTPPSQNTDQGTLGAIATSAAASGTGVVTLIGVVALVIGVGLFITGLIKLKAHKDTPTQVPISTGVVYLALGASLIFVPTLINVVGTTIYGTSKTVTSQTPAGAISITGSTSGNTGGNTGGGTGGG